MRLSVIIVSYNTRELLRRCLQSLGRDHEVFVIDNASKDGSSEMVRAEFSHVRLIENVTNVGFGAANNQGLDAMDGDLAFLLNSDAFATPDAVARLLEAMADDTIVACGGRLVDPSVTDVLTYDDFVAHLTEGRGLVGTEDSIRKRWKEAIDLSTQNSCSGPLTLWAVFCEQTLLEKAFPDSRLFSPYWLTRRLLSQNRTPVTQELVPVTQVMGACLMMRPVERFDERFFLYCEDTELCRRLGRHGKIVYVPGAVFGHELGASSRERRWESVARYNRGKELYFRIHHGVGSMVVCWMLDRLGAFTRLVAWSAATVLTLFAVRRTRNQVVLFAKVLFAPPAGPAIPPRTP